MQYFMKEGRIIVKKLLSLLRLSYYKFSVRLQNIMKLEKRNFKSMFFSIIYDVIQFFINLSSKFKQVSRSFFQIST